jgi:hypothetical protein
LCDFDPVDAFHRLTPGQPPDCLPALPYNGLTIE